MKKKFNRIARLVVYLEQEELEILQRAVPDGKLSEWARSKLVGHTEMMDNLGRTERHAKKSRFSNLPILGTR